MINWTGLAAPARSTRGVLVAYAEEAGILWSAHATAVVVSVVPHAVVCWGGGCSEWNKKILNRLIKRASSICSCPLDSIKVRGGRSTIMDNTISLLSRSNSPIKQWIIFRILLLILLVYTAHPPTCLLDHRAVESLQPLCYEVTFEFSERWLEIQIIIIIIICKLIAYVKSIHQ